MKLDQNYIQGMATIVAGILANPNINPTALATYVPKSETQRQRHELIDQADDIMRDIKDCADVEADED